jgi:hypothetical protein
MVSGSSEGHGSAGLDLEVEVAGRHTCAGRCACGRSPECGLGVAAEALPDVGPQPALRSACVLPVLSYVKP